MRDRSNLRPAILHALGCALALGCGSTGAPSTHASEGGAPFASGTAAAESGSASPSPSPSPSPAGSGAPAVEPVVAAEVVLGGANLCVRDGAGAVRCVGEWPLAFETESSVGQRNQYLHAPVLVAGLGDARALAVGTNRGCAVRADGSVACWGNTVASATGWSGAVADRLDAVPAPPLVASWDAARGGHYGYREAVRRLPAPACASARGRGATGPAPAGSSAVRPDLVL